MAEREPGAAPGAAPARGMRWIPGGTFLMGSSLEQYPEEGPVHRVSVDGFWMDEHLVTVDEFRAFVRATGYRTVAERALDPADYPRIAPELLVPGSLVFQKSKGRVDLRNLSNWWVYIPGASWRHPEGPRSNLSKRERHPVVHVAWEDVAAFAGWAGKDVPTEAEWEFAARGGLERAIYVWGNEERPRGRIMANTWQGEFPWRNLKLDGYEGTSPVGVFPANGYGLYDMAGNVWEWTSDFWTARHAADAAHPCCVPRNPRVEGPEASSDQTAVGGKHIPRRVIKGGSHLCAPNYCLRYRPAARQPQPFESAMAHLGFRCVVRPRRSDSELEVPGSSAG